MTERKYTALSATPLGYGTTYFRVEMLYPSNLTLDSPALSVMTDLRRVRALTIGPAVSISAANMKMIASGVRLLLVIDRSHSILGLVTATDMLGEKPVQLMVKAGRSHDDIQVQDIMTPAESLEALRMADVDNACIGDIIETLKRSGRQHALVMESDGQPRPIVRGIFSSTQIGRQIGIKLDVFEVAHSFAEIEQSLTR